MKYTPEQLQRIKEKEQLKKSKQRKFPMVIIKDGFYIIESKL